MAKMSPLQKFDEQLESVIKELMTRIVVPKMTEFDDVWEAANRVCDRYELEQRAA
jgi:maltose-binding protein MalE